MGHPAGVRHTTTLAYKIQSPLTHQGWQIRGQSIRIEISWRSQQTAPTATSAYPPWRSTINDGSLFCWEVLVVAHSWCESVKPAFFGSLAWCSHQSYFVSNSTSSDNKLFIFYHHLALSQLDALKRHPVPLHLHWLNAPIPGVSSDLT
jgi:hypothetical protein